VYRSLPTFRGDSRFSTWLYRLAVNVTRMHLRKGRSRPKFSDVDVPDVASEEDARRDDPESVVEQRERLRVLYRLLDGLGEKKREVLVLHDFEGMPAKEIAELVGAPVLTVRTRLFYARKELYAAMANEPALAHVLDALQKAAKTATNSQTADVEDATPQRESHP
jgi:RNA polymerase sigma-70 factor (ECF subfamily)